MNKMDINFLRVFFLGGSNIWTYYPVIEVWADIGAFEDYPSNKLEGLYERLSSLLPGLITHRCSLGEPGGFLKRLRDGTWVGHILEHIAIELQEQAGMKGGFGRTRETNVRGVYKIAIGTFQEDVGRAALDTARDLLMACIYNEPYDIEAVIEQLSVLIEQKYLGPSTLHILQACQVRKIPWIRLDHNSLVQLGYGCNQRRIWTAISDKTGVISEVIASNKYLTKSLLKIMGLSVPEGEMVHDPDEAWTAAQSIGLPVTVKPADSNHGKGVVLNVSNREDVLSAYNLAKKYTDEGVIIEQYISGKEYRLLVVEEQLVAAASGQVAYVIGDGKSSLHNLVDLQINSDPLRSSGLSAPLYILDPVSDPLIIQELKEQGYTIDSVPALGEKVIISRSGNIEFDVTDIVHPTFIEAAKRAARVVGLDIAGIDLVASDISTSIFEQQAVFLEVNAGPGLSCHITTRQGNPCKAGSAIVEHLFVLEATGRIPIIGITGSFNTTQTSKLVAWLMQSDKKQVGLSCKEGLFVGSCQISEEITMNFPTGRQLLINPLIESAVFDNDPKMILNQGLAYDFCTVGVVMNFAQDKALDEYYIHDSDDLYKVLRTQVDVVLSNGTAVLNADEPFIIDMAKHCDGNVILYSMTSDCAAIQDHLAKRNTCVFLRDNQLIIAVGEHEQSLFNVETLKQTIQMDAVLPAIAVGVALELNPQSMVTSLKTFFE